MNKEEFSCGIIPLRRTKDREILEVLLVQHRAGNYWGFPKGHKEEGELDFETASRELLEETGLLVLEQAKSPSYEERYSFQRGESFVNKMVRYFPCFVQGEVQLLQEEIIAAKWVFLSQADHYLTFPELKRLCKKVQEDFSS